MQNDPLRLDQTLIPLPEIPFSRIASALTKLGWTRDERAPQTPPLISGEPELAGWTEPGGRTITYTLNPVVRLRVLDAAMLTPGERAAIADTLPLASDEDFESALNATDSRRRLWAVFGARERELYWMQGAIAKLVSDREPIVAQAAAEAATLFARIAEARQRAIAGMKLVEEMVSPLLRALASPEGPELMLELRPTPADYALVFDPAIAAAVMHAYDRLWKDTPEINPGDGYPDLEVAAAPAGMFRSQNEVSWRFPQGYRAIAPWLQPQRTWIRWRYLGHGESAGGIAFDGLVWLDKRWAWFPKPFRVIPEIVRRKSASKDAQ